MYALTFVACAEALVEESIIGVDVAAEWSHGKAGSLYGAAVAAGADVASAAPGAGEVTVAGVVSEGPSDWVGYSGSAVVRGSATGAVEVDDVRVGSVPGARTWAADADGVLVGSSNYLVYFEIEAGTVTKTWDMTVEGLGAVGLGEGRALAVVCGAECVGWSWARADGAEVGEILGAGKGGAIVEIDGVVWAGDPDMEVDDGAGRACSEAGPCVEGLRGDHLGQAFGGGYVVGTFNKWIVPARARFVSLSGRVAYAMEVGAESRPIAVAGNSTTIVFGAPYYPHHGEPSGAVAVVRR